MPAAERHLKPGTTLEQLDAIAAESGWDWSLPPDCKPKPHTGFSTWSSKRFDQLVAIRGVFISWKRLSPKEGVIDLTPISEGISSNLAMGLDTGLHLMSAERQYVPEWVIEKYHPPDHRCDPAPNQSALENVFCSALAPGGHGGVGKSIDGSRKLRRPQAR